MSKAPETDPLKNPATYLQASEMAYAGQHERSLAAGYRAISAFVEMYPETVLDIDNAMPDGEVFETNSLEAIIERKLEPDEVYDEVAEIKEAIAHALVTTPPSESFINGFFRYFPKNNITDQISVIYGNYKISLVDIFDQERELPTDESIQAMSPGEVIEELVNIASDDEPYEHSAETLKMIQEATAKDAHWALDELGTASGRLDKTVHQLLQEITSAALSKYQAYRDRSSYIYKAILSGEAAKHTPPSKTDS